jgi:hypothetical protein
VNECVVVGDCVEGEFPRKKTESAVIGISGRGPI